MMNLVWVANSMLFSVGLHRYIAAKNTFFRQKSAAPPPTNTHFCRKSSTLLPTSH